MRAVVCDKYIAWVRENKASFGRELKRIVTVAPLLKDSEMRQCAKNFIGLEGFFYADGRFEVNMVEQRPSDLKALILHAMKVCRVELDENIAALQNLESEQQA